MATVKELRQLCRDRKIGGYSTLRKKDLIQLLDDKKNTETGREHTVERSTGTVYIHDPYEKKHTYGEFKIGIHVFKGDNMSENILRARSTCPLNAVQIFTHGPRNTSKNNNNYVNIRKVTHGISLYVHSSYPTNPWNDDEKIFEHTIEQFSSSHDLGAKGVVLHIPKMEPVKVAVTVKKLRDELIKNELLKHQKIILEMKAVKKPYDHVV